MARVSITESDLFRALHEADTDVRPDDAYTSAELGAALGLRETQTRKRIRALLLAGRAERIVLRLRAPDGRVVPTNVYRLKGGT
jgi:hypothetical protein